MQRGSPEFHIPCDYNHPDRYLNVMLYQRDHRRSRNLAYILAVRYYGCKPDDGPATYCPKCGTVPWAHFSDTMTQPICCKPSSTRQSASVEAVSNRATPKSKVQ